MEWRKFRVIGVQDHGRVRHSSLILKMQDNIRIVDKVDDQGSMGINP